MTVESEDEGEIHIIRELKQRRRRRRGRRLVKNDFLFYKRILRMFRSAWYANGSKNLQFFSVAPEEG